MPRFNQLQSKYGPHGLQVLGANYTNNDSEIQTFVSNFSANYAIARVADSSGYTVPVFSTVYAIDTDGTILFTGLSGDVTDAMVEQWLNIQPDGDSDKDDNESCSSKPGTGGIALLCVPATLLLLIRRAPNRQ